MKTEKENNVEVKITKDVGISCSIIGELLKHINQKEIEETKSSFEDTKKTIDKKDETGMVKTF